MPKDEASVHDPLELVGTVVPGEPGTLEAMAETFIEEYVRLGWDEQRLMTLFTSPMFLATHRIYRQKGEDYVRKLIRKTREKWGFSAGASAAMSVSFNGRSSRKEPKDA